MNSVRELVVESPFESVTVTVTLYVAAVEGLHVTEGAFAFRQPFGSPPHEYQYPPDPPEAESEKVTVPPTVTAVGFALGAEVTGSVDTWIVVGADEADEPYASVTVHVASSVPA